MKVFVYGTLKQGGGNHYLLDRDPTCKATTSSEFSLYVSGLPFMVKKDTDTPVKGEIYEINDYDLMTLDRLEGHPDFYKRETVTVVTDCGNKVECYAYIHPLQGLPTESMELTDEY